MVGERASTSRGIESLVGMYLRCRVRGLRWNDGCVERMDFMVETEFGLTRMSTSLEDRILIPNAMSAAELMMAYCWSASNVPIIFVAVLMSSIYGRSGGNFIFVESLYNRFQIILE